jgi:hypothetical protein
VRALSIALEAQPMFFSYTNQSSVQNTGSYTSIALMFGFEAY